MLYVIFGSLLILCGVGVLIYRLIDARTYEHWMDKESSIKSVLFIIVIFTFTVGGSILLLSFFLGW